MEAKPTLLIIYPYGWLAYAPTVLRLREILLTDFDVRIIAYDGAEFCSLRVGEPGIEYVALPRFWTRMAARLSRRLPGLDKRVHFWHIARAIHLWRILRRRKVDEVLAADYSGMWVAQKAFRKGEARLHFLSLEIFDFDFFSSRIDVERISSVVVQSAERMEWLFPKRKPPVFYIQNAPTFCGEQSVADRPHRGRAGELVYCGTPLPRFGILRILDFLREHSEFQLTIQGLINGESEEVIEPYRDLIAQGRLSINNQYLEEKDLLRWLQQFRVGLCFYDFDYLAGDHFNYRTVPSGKLFNYFAGGVPVVGLDIPGLNPVREFDAGVLISDLTPASIAAAVREVESNFAKYSANSLRAAAHYSFDRMAAPFLQSLRQQPRRSEVTREIPEQGGTRQRAA